MRTDLLRNTEIFVFLAMVFSIFTAVLLTDNKKLENVEIGYEEYKDSTGTVIDDLKKKYDSLFLRKEFYENELAKNVNNTSPHIELDGTQRFYFTSGESYIEKGFKKYLNDSIVPKLMSYMKKCKGCNAIYIVGHTDNKPVGKEHENLTFDTDVYNSIQSNNYRDIEYNSNTDLGLLRALSIYHFLKSNYSISKQIEHWFPMSSGPLIDPETGRLSENKDAFEDERQNDKKRRIEMWLYVYKKPG